MFDFPANPTDWQLYAPTLAGARWAWHDGAWRDAWQYTPGSLDSVSLQDGSHLGNLKFDITDKDPNTQNIDIYLTPTGQPLNKGTNTKYTVTYTPPNPATITLGDPAAVNFATNGDFSSIKNITGSATLGRMWTSPVAGSYAHASNLFNMAMISDDGINWRSQVIPDLGQYALEAIAWSPTLSLFVGAQAASTGYRGMTSPDGITWTIADLMPVGNFRDIIWVPELAMFIMVSSTSTHSVQTSTDGLNWTARTKPTLQARATAYSSSLGIAVIVGDSNTGQRALSSPDGINWTIRNTPADNNWKAVAWSPSLNLFAAVADSGSGNRAMTSPDGINWTIRTTPVVSEGAWKAVIWVGAPVNKFVAGGSAGNRIMTSTDGITWVDQVIPAIAVQSLAWSPELGLIIAVSSSGTSRVYTSPDAITWTARPNGPWANTWECVTYDPARKRFVAVGITAGINQEVTWWVANAVAGELWTVEITVDSITVGSGGGITAAFGNPSRELFSTLITTPGTYKLQATPLVNELWVGITCPTDTVVSISNVKLYSNRLVNNTVPFLGRQWDIVNGQAVHANTNLDNRVMTSVDGINWNSGTVPTDASPQTWYSICWSPELNLFCAVATTGATVTTSRVMTSPDGISWTIRTAAQGHSWQSVCWGGPIGSKKFVAVSSTTSVNHIMTSSDGITWVTQSTNPYSAALRSVCWSPDLNLFVAVSNVVGAQQALTSPDGITWTPRNTPAQQNWLFVCWAGAPINKFVAVANGGTAGNGGRVMTSPDGINWTQQPLDATLNGYVWVGVTYSPALGRLVAVANGGSPNNGRIMSSMDGITWTQRFNDVGNAIQCVIWSPEKALFVTVHTSGTDLARVLTSPDGITWTSRLNMPLTCTWSSVCWSPTLGKFVAVAQTGGINPELLQWKGLGLHNGDQIRYGMDVLSGSVNRVYSNPGRSVATGSITTTGYLNTTTIAGDADDWGFGANTDIAAVIDNIIAYKKLPTSLPQGKYDIHMIPRNQTMEGPETVIPNVTII